MRNLLFSLIIFILSIEAQAFPSEEYPIYCKKTFSYSYINGVNTIQDTARKTSEKIKNKLKIKDPVKFAYNQTKGMIRDLMDSVIEKIEEKNWALRQTGKLWSKMNMKFIDNRESVLEALKSHRKNRDEHIVFSHSQGNLYANIACDRLKEENLSFKNIQIATPASKINCGDKKDFVTIDNDEMYYLVSNLTNLESLRKKVRDTSSEKVVNSLLDENYPLKLVVDPPLKPNIHQEKFNSELFDFEQHSIDNYLSYPPSFNKIESIYSKIYDSVKADTSIINTPDYKVSCVNIDQFLNKELYVRNPFTFHNKTIHPSFFYSLSIVPTDKDQVYILRRDFKLITTILAFSLAIILFPFILIFFGQFLLLSLQHSSDDDTKNKNPDEDY